MYKYLLSILIFTTTSLFSAIQYKEVSLEDLEQFDLEKLKEIDEMQNLLNSLREFLPSDIDYSRLKDLPLDEQLMFSPSQQALVIIIPQADSDKKVVLEIFDSYSMSLYMEEPTTVELINNSTVKENEIDFSDRYDALGITEISLDVKENGDFVYTIKGKEDSDLPEISVSVNLLVYNTLTIKNTSSYNFKDDNGLQCVSNDGTNQECLAEFSPSGSQSYLLDFSNTHTIQYEVFNNDIDEKFNVIFTIIDGAIDTTYIIIKKDETTLSYDALTDKIITVTDKGDSNFEIDFERDALVPLFGIAEGDIFSLTNNSEYLFKDQNTFFCVSTTISEDREKVDCLTEMPTSTSQNYILDFNEEETLSYQVFENNEYKFDLILTIKDGAITSSMITFDQNGQMISRQGDQLFGAVTFAGGAPHASAVMIDKVAIDKLLSPIPTTPTPTTPLIETFTLTNSSDFTVIYQGYLQCVVDTCYDNIDKNDSIELEMDPTAENSIILEVKNDTYTFNLELTTSPEMIGFKQATIKQNDTIIPNTAVQNSLIEIIHVGDMNTWNHTININEANLLPLLNPNEGETTEPKPITLMGAAHTELEVCSKWKDVNSRAPTDDPWVPAPDADPCGPGSMKETHKNYSLEVINFYRWMVDLPDSEWNDDYAKKAQAAAFLMDKNGTLSHKPPKSWTCYSKEGFDGAQQSNLSGGVGSTGGAGYKSIHNYMIDNGNAKTMGHRRWILSNTLSHTAVGSTNNFSAMITFGDNSTRIIEEKPWVAWPAPGAFPITLNSEAIHKTGWTIQSDDYLFEDATLTITDDEGNVKATEMAVIAQHYGGYGNNAIRFIPLDPVVQGTVYHIKVNGLKDKSGNTTSEIIEYDVKFVDCN